MNQQIEEQNSDQAVADSNAASAHANTYKITSVMDQVLLALIPGTALHVFFFGYGTLLNLFLAVVSALLVEALTASWVGKSWRACLRDHSALVTAVIVALCLPPAAPWWLVVAANLVAITVAKQMFGGLSHNLFNPAMVGVVFALVSYPSEMTLWYLPTGDAWWSSYGWSLAVIEDKLLPPTSFDGISSATPLAHMRTELHNMRTVEEIIGHSMFGFWGGRTWEWINLGYLLGGLWLLWKKIIDWRLPLAMFAALFVLSTLAFGVDSSVYPPPLFHLLSGGVMLAAFFVITDPCTSCSTPLGKLMFGAGVGGLLFLIRNTGNFPDAVAFSVLLMNACVPLLDRWLIPKCFAEK